MEFIEINVEIKQSCCWNITVKKLHQPPTFNWRISTKVSTKSTVFFSAMNDRFRAMLLETRLNCVYFYFNIQQKPQFIRKKLVTFITYNLFENEIVKLFSCPLGLALNSVAFLEKWSANGRSFFLLLLSNKFVCSFYTLLSSVVCCMACVGSFIRLFALIEQTPKAKEFM